MLPLGEIEIGGGIVRQAFQIIGADGAPKRLLQGHRLTADEVRAMKNHRSLISSGRIAVYPKVASPVGDAQCHIVHNGGGRFDVIVGVRLNDRALTREEAEELATRPA